MAVKIQIINNTDFLLPIYATEGAAGMDLYAFANGVVTLKPMQRVLIDTGISIALPKGYEAQIRSRSGTVLKKGLVVLNSPGTIDSDYRGEIMVLLANLSEQTQVVKHGERIAQLVIAKYKKAAWERVTKFKDETKRGAGGFGSTGVL